MKNKKDRPDKTTVRIPKWLMNKLHNPCLIEPYFCAGGCCVLVDYGIRPTKEQFPFPINKDTWLVLYQTRTTEN